MCIRDSPEAPGAETTVNPCLSGGAIEVFLEPKIPAMALAIVGNTPIADALRRLGATLGYFVSETVDLATAVIIASHGRDEETSIRAALDAEVGFIGLVSSQKRGQAVLDEMELNPEERAAVRAPVGAWIGAKTAEEIALSILADIVKAVRLDGLEAPKTAQPTLPTTAIDPVCNMTVTVAGDTPPLHHDGEDFWFLSLIHI